MPLDFEDNTPPLPDFSKIFSQKKYLCVPEQNVELLKMLVICLTQLIHWKQKKFQESHRLTNNGNNFDQISFTVSKQFIL